MPLKTFLKGMGYFVLLIGTLLFGLFMIINYLFFNIDRVPEGELLADKISPNGEYTVLTYVINAQHSTVAPLMKRMITNGICIGSTVRKKVKSSGLMNMLFP